jgi:hypothetical protein
MSFLKDIIPEVKKDLAKDAIKYVAAGIGGIILIWTAKELKFLDDFLGSDLVTTSYSYRLLFYCNSGFLTGNIHTF